MCFIPTAINGSAEKEIKSQFIIAFSPFFYYYCYESEIFNCKIKNSGNRTGLRNDPEPYGSTVQFPDARTNLCRWSSNSTPSLLKTAMPVRASQMQKKKKKKNI
jgi:hypothetical protein